MPSLDETHDPQLRSWLASANAPGAAFPIQNLPFGVFRTADRTARVGVAIGELILDVAGARDLLDGAARDAAAACRSDRLNGLMASGPDASRALRRGLSRLLSDPSRQDAVRAHLAAQAGAELLAPVEVGDYTDFYASIFHAANVGRLFRPDNPLLPNYKWVPIAYHGRASSIVASGAPVQRPNGQVMPPGESRPVVRPSRSLDYELELGVYIGAASEPGRPIPIDEAPRHIFGACLLNDWSARDIQAWEYQPLGPFLSKNFATTVSPWVVSAEALEPFRRALRPRPEGDPEPLPYLASAADRAEGGYGIAMEAWISSAKMRGQGLEPVRISSADASDLYWTAGQMIAHHASGGCALRTGDLLGSGTVSGPDRKTAGCLLEITARGAEPISLPSGETRSFLEDGDEVILRGRCEREGFVGIGLGECRGAVISAG